MSNDDSSYVMVPVPEERVIEVYALLAAGSVSVEPTTPKPEAESTTAKPEAPEEWTDEEIRKAYRESTGYIRQVIDYLAARPGQRILFDELHEELGITSRQFAGVMGAFGKRIYNRHGGKDWFFRWEPDPETGWSTYIMSAEVASIIRDAG